MHKLSILPTLALVGGLCSCVRAQCPTLVWSDEFDGNSLDETSWNQQIGDGCDLGICGWGNNELQWYQAENTAVEDGSLRITARQESSNGKSYTSSRLTTRGKVDVRYGHLEARIKLPKGGGLWPAFWILSTDEVYGGWPESGEIDIMEWVGNDPDELLGTIHFGQPWPNNAFTGSTIEKTEGSWADDYHTFAVYWEPTRIQWFVDGYRYGSKTPSDLNGERWPFDQDFHFLLNVAVGGNLGGPVAPGIFPAAMEVDYVRVYDDSPTSLSGARSVEPGENYAYDLMNLPEGATVNWEVPAGVEMISGQGTARLVTQWGGGVSGEVTAMVESSCGAVSLSVSVEGAPVLFRGESYENFDEESPFRLGFTSGNLTEINNPQKNGINPSELVGRYVRDAGSQFDVLVYEFGPGILSPQAFVDGAAAFFMDLLTEVPTGTEILLQLETNAAGDNYPVGRHSRYRATVGENDSWHRLRFEFLDQPDASASPAAVNKLILLFAPNGNTGGTYLFDNLDLYSESQIVDAIFNVPETLPLTITPNPATEWVAVTAPRELAGPARLEVTDAGGRQVYGRDELLSTGRPVRLNVDSLPVGTYYLRITTAGQVAAGKVVRH